MKRERKKCPDIRSKFVHTPKKIVLLFSLVVGRHLETVFTDIGNRFILHALISKAIINANLPLKNLQIFPSEGPNVYSVLILERSHC